MIIISRPLSYVSTEDLEEPLTPSHLHIGHWLLSLPELTIEKDSNDPDFHVGPLSAADLTRRLRHLSNTMDQCWKRWKEYLSELRECHSYGKGTQSPCDPIVIRDIVLVYDQDHPRTFWRLAKVKDLIKGSDGKIQGAIIQIGSKGGKSSILRRPIQHLYPLEVTCIDKTETVNQNVNQLPDTITDVEKTSESSSCTCCTGENENLVYRIEHVEI